MSRYFKLIGIPFLIAVVIYLVIRFVWVPSLGVKSISVPDYISFFNDGRDMVVLVTRDDAINGEEFLSSLEGLLEGKKVRLYKLDMTNISSDDKQLFISANNFEEGQFIIPMVLYVKDRKLVDIISGYAPDYVVNEFITNNNIE